jgi:hypothetical protein
MAMTNDIDDLKRGYRSIKAPPHLATRVRAEVQDRPFWRHNWVPAGATIMAIVAVVWLGPFIFQISSTDTRPTKPSLSAIASLKPEKPTGTTMSLADIRSVKRPALPQRPRLKTTKPQTRLDTENDLLKEKDHVFI